MRTCSLVIAWNHNCYGIWGMKFIVRNIVSRNITVLNILSVWSAAHPRKIFVLTLQSFSLTWGTKCSMSLLPSSPARWTGNHLGIFSKLVPCRCSFAQEDHFFGAITGGWEALRCKGVLCQGLSFQLWGTTLLLSWWPDLENTEVQMSPLVRLAVVRPPIWLNTVGLGLYGGPWLCWDDSLPGEVSVQPSGCLWCSILFAGWFLQACLKTNPSTRVRACCIASLSSPPSQLTRDNWEHKSLLI